MKRDDIVLLLPEIFQTTYKPEDGNVLAALLGVMEQLHDPAETTLNHLDMYFDPDRLPEARRAEFLPFLARWMDLDWVLPQGGKYEAGLYCLHNLIWAAPQLASIRGTRQGLEQFLEVATGLPGYRVEDAPDQAFHILIHCPHVPEQLWPLVKRIAASEKPAYVKCTLILNEQTLPVGIHDQEPTPR